VQPRQAVLEALASVFPDHGGDFKDDTIADDVSGWDSFTHMQLMFEIESRLGRKVDVSKTYDLENVGALIRFLEAQSA
jgi:acyl carrier protein